MGWMGGPTASSFGAAAVLWFVVAFGPGVLVATAIDPWRSLLDRVAVAPLISFGLAFPLAAWAGAVGTSGSVWWAPAGLLVASIVSAVVVARRTRRAPPTRGAPPRGTRIAVLVAVAVAVIAWVVALSLSTTGWGSVVPGTDGAIHGMVVTDLLRSGSMFSPLVGRYDLGSAGPDVAAGPLGLLTSSYPYAVHLLAAPIGAATSVPSALLVPLTILPSACLVLGAVALARRTSGAVPAIVAGFAAAVLVPGFPFAYTFWGPVPMMMAVALVPAAVVVLADLRGPRLRLAVPAVAVAGMVGLHVTEALVAVGIVGLGVVLGREQVLRTVGRLLLCLAVALVLVAPLTLGMATGGAVRPLTSSPGVDPILAAYVAVARSFVAVTSAPAPLLVLVELAAIAMVSVCVVGAVVTWRTPLGRALVVTVAVSVVLVAASYVTTLGPLLAPWYGAGTRLGSQVAGLLPVLVGAGVVVLARRARALPVAAFAVSASVGVVVIGLMVGQSVTSAAQGMSDNAVVTPADRASFDWLAAHVEPGERVLNDDEDGSAWAYESTRGKVAPLFGSRPSGGFDGHAEFESRLHLRATIQDVATDARTRQEARDWGVRYVMVGERVLGGDEPTLHRAALAASSGLRLVFESGGARVYEILAS